MSTRINKRHLLKRTLSVTGGLRLLESVRVWNGLLVLNYHRIGTSGDSLFDHGLWSATQDDFDAQVTLAVVQCRQGQSALAYLASAQTKY